MSKRLPSIWQSWSFAHTFDRKWTAILFLAPFLIFGCSKKGDDSTTGSSSSTVPPVPAPPTSPTCNTNVYTKTAICEPPCNNFPCSDICHVSFYFPGLDLSNSADTVSWAKKLTSDQNYPPFEQCPECGPGGCICTVVNSTVTVAAQSVPYNVAVQAVVKSCS